MMIIHVPEGQPTIQAAVNAAKAGDVIIVNEGIFRENVVIFTDNLLIVGQGNKTILQAPVCEAGTGFLVNANGVQIHAFAIRNFETGVRVTDSFDTILENLELENNVGTGIEVSFSSNILLYRVKIAGSDFGIFPLVVTNFRVEESLLSQNLFSQFDIAISQTQVLNTEYRNNVFGLFSGPGDNVTVKFCNFVGNEFFGGQLFSISNGTIEGCVSNKNSFSPGIGSSFGTGTHFAYNQSRCNGISGILLENENSALVEFNEVKMNGVQTPPLIGGGGILLRFTNNTVVRFNVVKDNSPEDIIVIDGSDNTFIGNKFNTFTETPTDPV